MRGDVAPPLDTSITELAEALAKLAGLNAASSL